MANEQDQVQQQDQASGSGGAAAVTRPDYIPETIWDGEKNAPKIDLASTLSEYDALKAQTTERAAQIPTTPEGYKFELPEGFELPGGYKWQADPKDPIVSGFRQLAADLKLTQPEVQKLVAFEAIRQAEQIKSRADFATEQTKALGEKAGERRAAASTYIDSIFKKDDPQSAILKTLLDYAPGVEALEAIIAKSGIQTRGNSSIVTEDKNAANAAIVGTEGAGRKLLSIANAK